MAQNQKPEQQQQLFYLPTSAMQKQKEYLERTTQKHQQHQQQQLRAVKNAELQIAYQHTWNICHPNFKTPFASLEDACQRAIREFRYEERLMIEQELLQDEKCEMLELRTKLESREKAGWAHVRMAAMAEPDQFRPESQSYIEMMGWGPKRANAFGSQGNDVSVGQGTREQMNRANQDTVIGWVNNVHRDKREPSKDFLNDEKMEIGNTHMLENWRGTEEFDLNTR